MILSSIFEKPVDRPIEGVIKADDETSLRLEAEEYVLTNEVAKRLEEFLSAYNHYAGANGVWISGFFGSGKSHLLKMLALLLENRQVDGIPALDIFLPKCRDNEILRGDLKRAVSIPSRSILFNIDQKADVIDKSQVDALLSVFVKVFDEMCGYYGKLGYIAQFERDLDSRGLYDAFKQTFREISGIEWSSGREQALLESNNIASAFAQVTNLPPSDARGILDKYRADYKVSIEDFAEKVNAYISRQEPNFRLNFFVDEAGQYIADNIKLMTNLQTVAESLATKCKGRAWVIVTAQEDMNTVVGEMGKQQSNDFSKIQARFANRMKLTSADVAEVIRKRLLLKNEQGVDILSDVYTEQQNNFKTLFDFADGSQTYQNFRDRDQFIHSYPFIPYQYTLFQAAIQNLSLHNAFEGKHSSVGERSMLSVFQQVAIQIGKKEIGELATFDLMFEGIRTALKSQIQRSILTAEKHLENPFAVRLLKALFLVKYVKEFKATLRNLSVLMLDQFGADLPALRKRIEEALNLLEQQTYIQRNGEEYEYLTDEEKDVEEEIKNTEVETSAVADELSKVIFDFVIKSHKIRHDDYKQDYPFSRKLDDKLVGREYELAINVISPFHEHVENIDTLRMQSMGRDELLVIMPANDRLVRDLLMYKRTEKYVRQTVSVVQQDSIRRILTDKQLQNQERLIAIRKLVQDLLGKATLIVGGQEIENGGSDPQTRIVRGFHALIVRTYPNLRMLRGIIYSEDDIGNCLKPSVTLFGGDGATVSEAEQEMSSFIQSNQRGGMRTTMKSLEERFERKPYGWFLAAIQCILAKLCAAGKIEIRRDSTVLEDKELERALCNTQGFTNLVLEPQIDFTAAQVRQLKDFYSDFFDEPSQSTDAKALGKETGAAFLKLLEEIKHLRTQHSHYPFLVALDTPIKRLQDVTGKSYTFYLTELRFHEDDLFDTKEQVMDPIRRFMSGSHKDIYDEARSFLQTNEPNFPYAGNEEASKIKSLLEDQKCYAGNSVQHMKSLLDKLRKQVEEQVQLEKTGAFIVLEDRREKLVGMNEFAGLNLEQQKQLSWRFEDVKSRIQRQTLIAVVRDEIRRFEERSYPELLIRMSTWSQIPPAPRSGRDSESTQDEVIVITEPKVEYISQRSIQIDFKKAWLADEADVERYIASMRMALLAEIQKGKRIQI